MSVLLGEEFAEEDAANAPQPTAPAVFYQREDDYLKTLLTLRIQFVLASGITGVAWPGYTLRPQTARRNSRGSRPRSIDQELIV